MLWISGLLVPSEPLKLWYVRCGTVIGFCFQLSNLVASEAQLLAPSPQSRGSRRASSLLTIAPLALRSASGEKYVLRTHNDCDERRPSELGACDCSSFSEFALNRISFRSIVCFNPLAL